MIEEFQMEHMFQHLQWVIIIISALMDVCCVCSIKIACGLVTLLACLGHLVLESRFVLFCLFCVVLFELFPFYRFVGDIPEDYVNDGFCDCSDCDDETDWSCATCPGCPSACLDTVFCVGNDTNTFSPSSTGSNDGFVCDDGCVIPAAWENDDYCDCSNCEDEINWNCATCQCPTVCGDYYYCLGTPNPFTTTMGPFTTIATGSPTSNGFTTTTGNSNNYFICDDGCVISAAYENDDYCDCSKCEDEMNWNCTTCQCPTVCGGYNECSGTVSPFTTTDSIVSTIGNTNSYFICDDGCAIPAYYENDNWCDCSDCEDEPNWDCASCQCPTQCGDYYYCGGFTTDEPIELECDVDGNMQTVNWYNLLFTKDNDGIIPSIDISTFVSGNTLGFDVSVTSDYIVTSKYEIVENYYENVYHL